MSSNRSRCLHDEMQRRGGSVRDQDEWRRVGRACGYSGRRDLAGFYGGSRPSMVRNADGSRELTADGWQR